MKYMITWEIAPSHQEAAAARFLKGGAPMPEGMTLIGRWHTPGSQTGWLLVETDDPSILAQHMVEWGNLLVLRAAPVIGDEEAGKAMAAVYGT